MARKLAGELRKIREIRGVTLRKVEKETGISNAYLSQLERGEATKPSPQKLSRLSEYYRIPHEELMGLAGYTANEKPAKYGKNRGTLELILLSADLDQDEQEKVAEYIVFLTQQRKKGKR